jgi:hypothetical protein
MRLAKSNFEALYSKGGAAAKIFDRIDIRIGGKHQHGRMSAV